MDDIFNDDLPDDELVETEDFNESENFDEVIQLTQYDGGISSDNNQYGVIAEYNSIDLVPLKASCEKQAKEFTTLVNNLVTSFNDVELTEEHKAYLKSVSNLQMTNLKDFLYMVELS